MLHWNDFKTATEYFYTFTYRICLCNEHLSGSVCDSVQQNRSVLFFGGGG